MGRDKRYSSEEKLFWLKRILSNEISLFQASKISGIRRSTLSDWKRLYETDGLQGLMPPSQNQSYPALLKRAAVEDYLAGNTSLAELCKKYNIRSDSQLRIWIKRYNSGKDFGRKMSGGSRMKKTRKTSQEERIQIVKACMERGFDYGATALEYKVSYQQVRTWTLRYIEYGESGLEDRRGRRKKDQTPRTELEKAQIEIEKLKHQLYMAEMERDLLKKLNELERGEFLDK